MTPTKRITAMNYKRRGCLSAICAVLIAGNGCLPRRGDRVVDTWEATAGTLKVRIRKFDEKHSIWPHKYQVFEAAAGGSANWRELLEWRTDDYYPIEYDRVQIVSPQVVSVFRGTKYVVTTDAGQTWTTWDAEKHSNIRYKYQIAVKDVRVSPDGTGTMVVISDTEPYRFLTLDYGLHWALK